MNYFVVALLLGLLGCTSSSPRATNGLDCRAIAKVTATMLEGHVYYSRVDAALRSRVAESYLDRLDPERILFTRPEVSSAQAQVEQTVDQVESGDCAGIHALESEVESRLRGLVRLAEARSQTVVDPGSVPASRGVEWPASSRELTRRQVQSVDSWISTYSAIDAKNAGQLVIEHYERIAQRFADRGREDTYATYLSAFARALDRDSSYLPPKAIEDFRKGMRPGLAGIGLALSERDGSVVVERLIPGGSADREGGVQVGDRIYGIGEGLSEPDYVTGLELSDVVQLIRGRAGTEVTLTVLTPGAAAARRVSLTRRSSDPESQLAELRFRSVERGGRRFEIAILVLPSFYSDPEGQESPRDVIELLREIDEEHADGVVADLRDNGGGSLDAAIEITGLFIEAGPIGMTRERTGAIRVLSDPDPRIHCAAPMVVLTSRTTAAAAELLAGALKDYRRALVVGDERTLGRGTLQSIYPMSPALGAVKLTTGTLYAPGGRSLEGNGVASDISLGRADDRTPDDDRRFTLPDEAVSAVAGESTSPRGFVAIDPRIVAELSRRSEQRSRASRASAAAANPDPLLWEGAEILADYLAMEARETTSR